MGQRIKCVHCNEVIESLHVHDYRRCKCGTVAIDGGDDYTRTAFTVKSDYVLTQEPMDPKYFEWGTLGKDGKGPYKTIRLVDADTDHLEAILETQKLSPSYREAIGTILFDRLKKVLVEEL